MLVRVLRCHLERDERVDARGRSGIGAAFAEQSEILHPAAITPADAGDIRTGKAHQRFPRAIAVQRHVACIPMQSDILRIECFQHREEIEHVAAD
jgi:hypothetical protein